MKNYLEFFTSTENLGIGLNTDIFETNIVNIAILLVILFIVIKNFLTENLTARKKKIVDGIENAETRLADSNKRYTEAKKQWAQMDIIIGEINDQMEKTKQNVLKLKWEQGKDDLAKKFTLAISVLRNRETKIFNDIIKEVSKKALNRVIFKVKKQLGKVEQSAIINRKIMQLGD
uniref:CF0 subunit I n=1 Tax=Chorda asiatica TaxID=1281577 RepID=A0A8F0JYG4_9PHAE|nr:ATP synthase CF0, subunit B [Chorda asiatica]QWK43066.1 CF0 subunit I [Chorda asiatica]WAM62185.1 ATP synthase CF0, subunit B [Chorda asiatica]